MSIYELDVGWAVSGGDRRYLRWELLACEEVLGVFTTPRAGRLAVLYSGSRLAFRLWARSIEPESAITTTEGAIR
jgi:hypothetical protein